MKIVCIGDSLTFGYGVFRTECWVELVKNKLNIPIINKGSNGDTTAGMLSRSYNDIIENTPTHVIIMGGSNDFMANRSLSRVQENIKELIKESIEHNITSIVGIEPPIDKILALRKWSGDIDYDKINSLIKDYRHWALRFAKENNITCVDFHKCFLQNLRAKDPRELYVDGLHPTALGHKLMVDCVIDVLSSIN